MVRAFMARMAEEKPAEARKVLERHLPLPGILARICDHPCENVCLRLDLGGSLAVHALELACVSTAAQRSRLLPMPRKRFRLAVLGAGLAGLAAAYDLSRKGYLVTVFHQGEAWDVLLERYPVLKNTAGDGEDALAADQELLDCQQVLFSEAVLDAQLLERAETEYDGVLIDADAARTLAPPESEVDDRTMYWRGKICCAGPLSVTPTGHRHASASRQAGGGPSRRPDPGAAGKRSLPDGRARKRARSFTYFTGGHRACARALNPPHKRIRYLKQPWRRRAACNVNV